MKKRANPESPGLRCSICNGTGLQPGPDDLRFFCVCPTGRSMMAKRNAALDRGMNFDAANKFAMPRMGEGIVEARSEVAPTPGVRRSGERRIDMKKKRGTRSRLHSVVVWLLTDWASWCGVYLLWVNIERRRWLAVGVTVVIMMRLAWVNTKPDNMEVSRP